VIIRKTEKTGDITMLRDETEYNNEEELINDNRIHCCLSPLFQKIHHERARRTCLKELFQEERQG
jgi:hypothetical protein